MFFKFQNRSVCRFAIYTVHRPQENPC